MYKTAPGIMIPYPERIQEKFQLYEEGAIRLNISFEKLDDFIREFYHQLPEPLFFVLQFPLSIDEEQEMGYDDIYHQEVLYLDAQTQGQIDSIMEKYGRVLLEDGISQFAIASHASHEEIFVQKYKVIDLYSPKPRRFIPLLQRFGISETKALLTAWDTFTDETPGECSLITVDGLNAYKIAEKLKEEGMYRAKIIER